MNKSIFYAVLVGSLLCGIGLGRCGSDGLASLDSLREEEPHISLSGSMAAIECMQFENDAGTAESFVNVVQHSGSVTVTEKGKLEEYTPPSGFLHSAKTQAKKVGSVAAPWAEWLATKSVACQLSFIQGEFLADMGIKGIGYGISLFSSPVGAAFMFAGTTLNHTASYIPCGEALRGVILTPMVEPLLKPAARMAWWVGEKTLFAASSAWAYCWTPSQTLAPGTVKA